jgi:hypothetical protein
MTATIIPFPIRPPAARSLADYACEARKLHPDWTNKEIGDVAAVCVFIDERLAARGVVVRRG